MDNPRREPANCGAASVPPGEEANSALQIGDVLLRFSPFSEPVPLQPVADPDQQLPGWHRVGLACKRLEEGVSAMLAGRPLRFGTREV